MPVVLRVPGIAIIQRDMGRNQANLFEVNGRLDVHGKLAEERIIQINFDEVLLLVIQVGQHQAKEALRRVGALGCVRAVILKHHCLQLFLVDELQLEGNRGATGNLSITLRTIAIGLRFWFRLWLRVWLRLRFRVWLWFWTRFRFWIRLGLRIWFRVRLGIWFGPRFWIGRPGDHTSNNDLSCGWAGEALDVHYTVGILRRATRRALAPGIMGFFIASKA